MNIVLVTGTTGNVGSEVLKALRGRELRRLAEVTDIGKAEPLLSPSSERIGFFSGDDST